MSVYKLESEWDLGLDGLLWQSLELANRDVAHALECADVGYNLAQAKLAGLIRLELWEVVTK